MHLPEFGLSQLDRKPESWEAGFMKMTLDLPVDLVREMKLKAAHEGRKLREVATEIFRLGLASPKPPGEISRKRVRLPLIECGATETPTRELTADRVADILLNQEADWTHEASGR